MKNFFEEKKAPKNISIKNIIILFIILIIIIGIITVVILYVQNVNVRNWIDKYILRKEITQEDTISIELRRR